MKSKTNTHFESQIFRAIVGFPGLKQKREKILHRELQTRKPLLTQSTNIIQHV